MSAEHFGFGNVASRGEVSQRLNLVAAPRHGAKDLHQAHTLASLA
jgi:hypothetical protein